MHMHTQPNCARAYSRIPLQTRERSVRLPPFKRYSNKEFVRIRLSGDTGATSHRHTVTYATIIDGDIERRHETDASLAINLGFDLDVFFFGYTKSSSRLSLFLSRDARLK